jgi:hypothetical protein
MWTFAVGVPPATSENEPSRPGQCMRSGATVVTSNPAWGAIVS